MMGKFFFMLVKKVKKSLGRKKPGANTVRRVLKRNEF